MSVMSDVCNVCGISLSSHVDDLTLEQYQSKMITGHAYHTHLKSPSLNAAAPSQRCGTVASVVRRFQSDGGRCETLVVEAPRGLPCVM